MTAGSGFFIAGTDTGVGKTRITVALIRAWAAAGRPVRGMKPVATGADRSGSRLIADDTRQIAAASDERVDTGGVDWDAVTPYAFVPPVSPHIAADRAGVRIDIDTIAAAYDRLRRPAGVGGAAGLATICNTVIVEGTGGWLAPIGERLTMADIAVRLALPVVLVVGLRLGCLNHALLTAAAIRAAGLPLAGWVGNALDPAFDAAAENVATLEARLGSAALALLPYAPDTPVPAAAMQGFLALSLALSD